MIQFTRALPIQLSANLIYDSIAVENLAYDPINHQYTARVYGVCRGSVMPLIVVTPVAVHRIEDVTITDAEIDTTLTNHPDLGPDRLAGAMARAFERLYALAAETQEAPYNA